MLKCIYCGKEAEFICAGQSVCKEHLMNISSWDIPGGKKAIKMFDKFRSGIQINDIPIS